MWFEKLSLCETELMSVSHFLEVAIYTYRLVQSMVVRQM